MSDMRMSRRAPAVLVLLALLALVVSVCHGSHGHTLPVTGTTTTAATAPTAPTVPTATTITTVAVAVAPAPAFPHGCGSPEDTGSYDAHLPALTAQTASPQGAAPDAGGAVPPSYAADLRTDPRARCVRGRAGPGPEPGRLLIALGVDRN
ncbi:hypothetical protein [Streptomyces sp. NPDC056144]|uniref:hypothetical protein n=1 Tax=unclassified Streptomyces TaxID=2593676 RepID=UPI0035DF9EC1